MKDESAHPVLLSRLDVRPVETPELIGWRGLRVGRSRQDVAYTSAIPDFAVGRKLLTPSRRPAHGNDHF
jgi:hypothetical protein